MKQILYRHFPDKRRELCGGVSPRYIFILLTATSISLSLFSMQQSPSWDANMSFVIQEIPHTLCNPKCLLPHSQVPPPVAILCSYIWANNHKKGTYFCISMATVVMQMCNNVQLYVHYLPHWRNTSINKYSMFSHILSASHKHVKIHSRESCRQFLSPQHCT